jgi:hypothetical protein
MQDLSIFETWLAHNDVWLDSRLKMFANESGTSIVALEDILGQDDVGGCLRSDVDRHG